MASRKTTHRLRRGHRLDALLLSSPLPSEFLEFVESCYLPEMANAPAAITAVAHTESVPERDERKSIVKETDRLEENTVPYKLENLFVNEIEVNYKELIECLRKKTNLNHVTPCDATVVFSNENDELKVWQLSHRRYAFTTLRRPTHSS